MLWWIAQHVAVTAVLAALVRLLYSTRRIGPAVGHAMWLVVLVKLMMPPLLVWPWGVPALPAFSLRGLGMQGNAGGLAASQLNPATLAAPSAAHMPTNKPGVPADLGPGPVPTWPKMGPNRIGPDHKALAANTQLAAPRPAAAPSPTTWHAQLQALAAWAWIAGALIVSAVHCLRIARMARLTRRGSRADPALQRIVDALADRLHVRSVETRVVDGLHSPLIWCTNAPLLLWPGALDIGTLSAKSLRGLIAHEFAHVRRRDHWVGWLELLGSCVWWWNPLFWYVLHQLREQSELACDAWVVRMFPQGRCAYAEGLLAVCQSISEHSMAGNLPVTALGAGTGNRRFLERRLTMIVRENRSSRLTRLALAGVILLGGATLPAWAQETAPRNSSEKYVKRLVGLPGDTVIIAAAEQAPANAPGLSSPNGAAAGQAIQVENGVRFLRGEATLVLVAVPGLPPEAQKALDEHNRTASAAREELEKKLAEDRHALIRELREMQDRYTRDAKLDEAVAIRDTIRQLEATATERLDVLAAPVSTTSGTGSSALPGGPGTIIEANPAPAIGNPNGPGSSGNIGSSSIPGPARAIPDLSAFRGRTGLMILLQVTGTTEGAVWGSETYTDDSSIAAAAVHAGVLKPGETGLVAIVLQPGQPSYKGSTQNGVTSQSYKEWQGSFTISRAPEGRTGATILELGTETKLQSDVVVKDPVPVRIYNNAPGANTGNAGGPPGPGIGNSTGGGADPNAGTAAPGTTPPTPDSSGGPPVPGAGGR